MSTMPVAFRRHHRCRLFLHDNAHVSEVWDTVETPFVSPGFPRGVVIFESIAETRREVADVLLYHRRTTPSIGGTARVEVLHAPAETWRCRVFRLSCQKLTQQPRFVEVWDTVAEPCEYRRELPSGDLLAQFEDYSPLRVQTEIRQRERELGILIAGTWGLRSHT